MSKFDSSSSSGEDDWGEDYSYSDEEASVSTYSKPAVTNATADLEQLSGAELLEEAPIDYDTVRFGFNVKWTAADLVDTNGNLRYEGKIPLSLMNDKLRLEEFNVDDFKNTETLDVAPLDAKKGSKKHHRKHKKEHRRHIHRDLLKNVRLVDVTTNWPCDIGVELPGVSAIGKEGWHNRSPVVARSYAAGTFSPSTPVTKDLLSRRVTKGMVVFNNKYGGQTWETHKEKFEELKSGVLIPFDSPWRMYHNMKYNSAQLTKPSDGYTNRKVLEVSKQLEAEISAIAERDMKSKLSVGDVTHNFSMNLFVPIESGTRTKEHRDFLETGKGTQWMHFADHYAVLSDKLVGLSKEQAKPLIADFRKQQYYFRGCVEADYVHLKSQKIPMNTTLSVKK